MGFDSGSVSLRACYLTGEWSPDILERFAAQAAPPLDSLSREPIEGWVSGRHLLDRDLSEDNSLLAGYLYLNWMRAERKVPEALLRAHCRIEEDVEMRARGIPFAPRKLRAEIKEAVRERLLPTMPPTLTGTPMVLDFRNNLLLAGTTSDNAFDKLAQAFQRTTGVMPIALTPETAAMKRSRLNPRDLDTVVFSPHTAVEPGEMVLGDDFLTWLWFECERSGGVFNLDRHGEPFGVMLEGPLLFFHAAEGAHEAVLRKGSPLLGEECGTALWFGKKLRRARLSMARAENTWSVSIDASNFAFRSLKLPKNTQSDPTGRFHERMLAIETFQEALLVLFDRFLALRADQATWPGVLQDMQTWIARRAGQPA